MKKLLLSLLTVMMIAVSAKADVAAFIADGATYSGSAPAAARTTLSGQMPGVTFTIDGVCSLQLTKFNSSTSYVTGSLLRWYQNDEITITCASGVTIDCIKIQTSESKYSTAGLTWQTDGMDNPDNFNTGDAQYLRTQEMEVSSSVVMKTKGQIRLKWIEIVYHKSASGLKNAELSFPADNYTVTLGETFQSPALTNPHGLAVTYSSSAAAVATVAADGTVTPVGAGTAKISARSAETAEYYAGNATYTLRVISNIKCTSLKAFVEATPEKNDQAVMDCELNVVYSNGNYVYVKDASASSLIFKSGTGLKAGDVISGGWEGKNSVYNGMYEIVPIDNISASGKTFTVEYPVVADVDATMVNQVVTMKNVVFDTSTPDKTGNNFTGKVGEKSYTFRTQFSGLSSVEPGTYDVVFAVGTYNGSLQLYPIKYTVAGAETPEDGIYTGINDFIKAKPTTESTIRTPLTVLYQNGRNLYLKDGADGYILAVNSSNVEGINGQFKNGDVLASITGTFKNQSGLPEIIPSAVGEKSAGTAVEPTEHGIDELSSNMLNQYVRLTDVTVTDGSKANNYVLSQGTEEVAAYNTFYNAQYYTVVEVPTGAGYTVDGFISIYNGTLQITPISVTGGTRMEQVEAPVFSHASGQLEEGTKVSITCATEGARIYYTTDGTEPTTASDEYTAELPITDNVTIKAIAAKEGMLNSTVVTVNYTVKHAGDLTATIDFTNAEQITANSDPKVEVANAGAGTSLNGVNVTAAPISAAFSIGTNDKNNPMWWHYKKSDGTVEYTEARVYTNNTFTVTAAEGYQIQSITFTQNAESTNWSGTWADAFEPKGTWDAANKSWASSADDVATVTVTVPGNSRFATMTVVYAKSAAIGDIESDIDADAPVEYYNLQGIRVNGDNLTPGIYIMRQGKKTSKILVR